jgi:alpha-ketoglutarate-dependent 2,4-dichlorophenoxyacetate dioxygenase
MLTVKPLHTIFGAEIIGLKVGPEIGLDIVEALEDLMARFALVVLRDQDLSDDDQVAFARFFGPRESPAGGASYGEGSRNRLPQFLFDAGNLGHDGEILPADSPRRKIRLGDRLWHSDSSFNPLPTKWSMLYGRVVPPPEAGANTEFVDTRAAYDSLPAEIKARLEGLVAEHSLWHSRVKGGMPPEMIGEAQTQVMPPAYQPIVRTNSKSGRKSLLIGAHAGRIPGLADDESQELLDFLMDHATQKQFIYVHEWRLGDLVMWDNRCTLHRATPFEDTKYKRDMRRITVDEYAPSWASVG